MTLRSRPSWCRFFIVPTRSRHAGEAVAMQLGILRGIHHCTAPGRGDLRVRPAQLCNLVVSFRSPGRLSTRTAIATLAATNADRAHLRADSRLWPLRLRLGSEGLGDRA